MSNTKPDSKPDIKRNTVPATNTSAVQTATPSTTQVFALAADQDSTSSADQDSTSSETATPSKNSNTLKSIFTPKAIIILVIVDIILGTFLGLFESSQLKNNIATEYNLVTNHEVGKFLYPGAYKLHYLSGTVKSIEVQPDQAAIEADLQHQPKWSGIIVHIASDDEVASNSYYEEKHATKDDFQVMFTPDTIVLRVDNYGNVNSETLSVGNRVEIYYESAYGELIKAKVLVKNISAETDTIFQHMLKKVTVTEFVADFIAVVIASVLVYLIIYSIRFSTKNYFYCMFFVAAILAVCVIVKTSIVYSEIRDYKQIIIKAGETTDFDTEFTISHMRFDGMESIDELMNEQSKPGSEAVKLFNAIPYDASKKYSFNIALYGDSPKERVRPERYTPDRRYYSEELKGSLVVGYYTELHSFDTPQEALFEFDCLVDYWENFASDDVLFSRMYFSDDEIIVYNKVDDHSRFDAYIYALVYIRLDDDKIVFYDIEIDDFATAAIEDAKQFFDKAGIDAYKVEFAEDLPVYSPGFTPDCG